MRKEVEFPRSDKAIEIPSSAE
ncbi:amino acid carrier family protein, partial [Chlamydia psittaci 84-8471/1]